MSRLLLTHLPIIQNRAWNFHCIGLGVCHYTVSTGFSKQEIDKAKLWLNSVTVQQIPTKIFDITYSRASGAGGQKVNKTSSKATVALDSNQWLNPQFCYWIPQPILSQISTKPIRYETKNGALLIQSDASRNRDVNTDECFKKLLTAIRETVFFEGEVSQEDLQKWDQIKEDVKEKRLFHKKLNSDKKKNRTKRFEL